MLKPGDGAAVILAALVSLGICAVGTQMAKGASRTTTPAERKPKPAQPDHAAGRER
jgi:hypothetical protein